MCREEKRNAMHGPMWTALREAALELAKTPPRVLIITGTGGHFSAGMDLSPRNPIFARLAPAAAGSDVPAMRALIEELKSTMNAFADLPCVTVSAIDGACCGSGLELALATDLRVASGGAFFSLPETLVGLAPDVGGAVRLTRLVGRSRATDLALTGRRIDAAEAERWGMIDRLVANDAFKAALELANDLLSGAPEASRATLSVIRSVPELSDADAFEAETQAGIRTLLSGEFMEGMAAFIEKRAPRWKPE